jgi:thiamine phosphate synthase YjbQ (UPF0047 family)
LPAHSSHLRYATEGDGDVVDLTAGVAQVVAEAGSVTSGIASVFVPGATAAVTTMENEPGNVLDLRALLDRLVPPGGSYQHNR